MRRYVMQIEYDGSHYAGFQLQPDMPSIQGELEKALGGLYKVPVRVHPSGRTDAGVHALAQIVHFDAPRELRDLNLKAAMNRLLPRDIRVLRSGRTDTSFHARFSARKRTYRYTISTRETALDRDRVWQIFRSLDFPALQESAAVFEGEHDFTAFCSAQAEVKHKYCRIYRSFWEHEQDRYTYYIEGNRFLHSMVRSLTGTMVEVAKGRLEVRDLRRILESRSRSGDAVTAPPQGLFLLRVEYEFPLPWELT